MQKFNKTEWIKRLEIENFKSIRHIETECRRINLIVGAPNSGKTNLIEALSLFLLHDKDHVFLNTVIKNIRFSNIIDWFYFQDIDNAISIRTNLNNLMIKYLFNNEIEMLSYPSELKEEQIENIRNSDFNRCINADQCPQYFSNNIRLSSFMSQLFYNVEKKGEKVSIRYLSKTPVNTSLKHYIFDPSLKFFQQDFSDYLLYPYGENLFRIMETHKPLREVLKDLVSEMNMEVVLDKASRQIFIQKKEEDNLVTQLSYDLLADTTRRILFFLAAIHSNKQSILLFEEPEANLFPPYVSYLIENIIHHKENQYFITTHSPYVLSKLVEKCAFDEYTIMLMYYDAKSNQSKLKLLTEEEIRDIHQNIEMENFFLNISALIEK